MMSAYDYGNAGAYFANSSNIATARMLGLGGGYGTGHPVSAYTTQRQDGSDGGLTLTARMTVASSMIPGHQGMRAVAFPLVPGWNWVTPGT